MIEKIKELERIIETLDQEGVDKCEKLEAQAKQIKKLEKALDKVCGLIENLTGGCPLSQFDVDLNCEDCCDDYAGCWKKWAFIEEEEIDDAHQIANLFYFKEQMKKQMRGKGN